MYYACRQLPIYAHTYIHTYTYHIQAPDDVRTATLQKHTDQQSIWGGTNKSHR